jgi:hypothetical protein
VGRFNVCPRRYDDVGRQSTQARSVPPASLQMARRAPARTPRQWARRLAGMIRPANSGAPARPPHGAATMQPGPRAAGVPQADRPRRLRNRFETLHQPNPGELPGAS